MKLWNDIKKNFKSSSKKVLKVTEELVEKGKESGGEGLLALQDILSQVGDKANVATSAIKLKFEANAMQKQLETEAVLLGNLVFKKHKNLNTKSNAKEIQTKLDKMLELDKQITNLKADYDEVRKELSDDYIVNKLSHELNSSGAVIEQVTVSPDSNVADKLLKELLLPKEALISAIKRNNEIIIPDGNTKIEAGDVITLIGKTEDVYKTSKRIASR